MYCARLLLAPIPAAAMMPTAAATRRIRRISQLMIRCLLPSSGTSRPGERGERSTRPVRTHSPRLPACSGRSRLGRRHSRRQWPACSRRWIMRLATGRSPVAPKAISRNDRRGAAPVGGGGRRATRRPSVRLLGALSAFMPFGIIIVGFVASVSHADQFATPGAPDDWGDEWLTNQTNRLTCNGRRPHSTRIKAHKHPQARYVVPEVMRTVAPLCPCVCGQGDGEIRLLRLPRNRNPAAPPRNLCTHLRFLQDEAKARPLRAARA
jgi:hypothetical protein